ncbi:hypothetical protein VM98_37640, partial [Streptomyces rubellomurinus subsp. indigoferus]
EFVDASRELLPRGGRFLEMGKTDLRQPEAVARQHAGLRYRAYDLVTAAGPERIQEMLVDLAGLFERKLLVLSAIRSWHVRRRQEAFRYLPEGRTTGKVVLTVPAPTD